jgi:hypothetical protein
MVKRTLKAVAYSGILCEGGSTNSVEGRGNGDLGAVAPKSGVPLNLQMSETHIIRLLWMGIWLYFVETSEFRVGLTPPPPRYATDWKKTH